MKTKLIFLPLAALTVFSCRKADVTAYMVNPSEDEIVFLASAPSSGTRAYLEAGAASLEEGGFKVAGIASGSSGSFFNEKASWNSTSSCFKTTGTYYHPSGNPAAFSAVYPSTLSIDVNAGKSSLNYTSNVTDDVMAAYSVPSQKDKAVQLAFNHILSQVCVKAKGADSRFTYNVKTVKLSGSGSGTYDFSSGSWTSVSGTRSADYYSGSKEVSTSEYSSFGSDNMAFIPKGTQTGGKASLTITVEYQMYLGTTLISDFTGEQSRSVTVDLEQGKRCVVNCTLPTGDINPISFTVTVVPWADADVQNVQI